MRSLFSVVPVLVMGLIGCGNANQITDHGAVAGSTPVAASTPIAASAPNPKDDPSQICPDICGDGTLCVLPSGACGDVCNACYCTRDGGTVVNACPKASSAQQGPDALQSLAKVVAARDGNRSP